MQWIAMAEIKGHGRGWLHGATRNDCDARYERVLNSVIDN